MKVKVEPLKPQVGAIIHANRATLADPDVVQQCLEALESRDVLVFPKLNLTDDEQLAFTDSLGARVDFTNNVPGGNRTKDIYQVTLDKEINNEPEYVLGTFFWHMDGMPV